MRKKVEIKIMFWEMSERVFRFKNLKKVFFCFFNFKIIKKFKIKKSMYKNIFKLCENLEVKVLIKSVKIFLYINISMGKMFLKLKLLKEIWRLFINIRDFFYFSV